MTRCLEIEEATALEPGDLPPDHLAECEKCASLVEDVGRVRIMAIRVGSAAWADVPALDVELALRRVRARALVVHRGGGGARVPQVLSAAAAALLLCALVGPYALRQRVERPPGGGFCPGRDRVVFWTSGPEDVGTGSLVTAMIGEGR